uniref:non-specific serine/threonine protein kinase n=1 Tax=Anthurium amnicola TaxID=1678845 RepID=A0A1D1Z7M5_9ARAE
MALGSLARVLFLYSLLVQTAGALQGFVSINCCGTRNTTDPIPWISDDDLLPGRAGECRNVSVNTASGGSGDNATARVFTARGVVKWCYELPAVDGQAYLVRATFLGGPNLMLPRPSGGGDSFDLSICSTPISRVVPSTADDALQTVEGVCGATGDLTDVCLVNSNGSAYISKLELRPLSDGGVYLEGDHSTVLKLVARVDAGNRNPQQAYRYPADPSDRIWSAETSFTGRGAVNSSKATPRGATTYVPLEVLQTAAEDPDRLVFLHTGLDAGERAYLIILHLMELQPGVRAGQRRFDVYVNGARTQERALDILGGGDTAAANYRAVKLRANASGFLNISLVKAADAGVAGLGPICNAYEIFQVYRRGAQTARRDGEAARKLREELLAANPGDGVVGSWYGDPCAPSPPWEGVACEERESHGNTTLVITKLDLSRKGLQGPLPSVIAELTDLRELDLQSNNFTGSIPESLVSLPHLTKLSVDCNSQLPPGLWNRSNLNMRCDGHYNSGMQPCQRNIFIGSVAGASVAFTVAFGIIFTCFYKRVHRTERKDQKIVERTIFSIPSSDSHSRSITIQQFPLEYIRNMTSNYKTMIAEGGFGVVYRGTLAHGQEVAVKVRSATSTQGTREFENEVNLLSAIHHGNLVPLLGYCRENDQQILVYPFMSNGSLQDRLYGEAAKRKALDWPTRLSIALGTARGLMYLHNFEGRCIIHRDVKSSNILLDDSMSAKVADFGFSKYAPQEGDSGTSLEVRGTAGYLDPEYYSTQNLSTKSDVFSFGVVLLEIISGREPLNIHRPRNEWSLVEWAKAHIRESRIDEIVDPSIRAGYHPETMWRVVEIASTCVESFSIYRPSMEDIVRELEDALIIENNASEYMRSIESFGGSNRFVSLERKMLAPIPSPTEPSPTSTFCEIMSPPQPR